MPIVSVLSPQAGEPRDRGRPDGGGGRGGDGPHEGEAAPVARKDFEEQRPPRRVGRVEALSDAAGLRARGPQREAEVRNFCDFQVFGVGRAGPFWCWGGGRGGGALGFRARFRLRAAEVCF